MNLNTNNKQLAFQFKPKTNEYVLETITDTMVLSTDNIRLKYYQGEDLFCVDVGYSIDGDVSKMSFKIDDLIVYPVVLKTPDKLQQQAINNQAIYIISEDYNFKSIIFIPIAQLNKTFEYTITSYNSCISSFVVDEIGRKFNSASIATEASQVSNNNSLGANVQVALDILELRFMIDPYYTQYALEDGTFDSNEVPSNWFKKMYGVTTTWKIIFNDKSAFFRTEGTKSNVSRSKGLQPYGMKKLYGGLVGGFSDGGPVGIFSNATGVFDLVSEPSSSSLSFGGGRTSYITVKIDTSGEIKHYSNDIVVDNYQIRIYKLLTINGKTVSQIIQGV